MHVDHFQILPQLMFPASFVLMSQKYDGEKNCGEHVEFTLVYEGQLKSNSDLKHKHAIRTQLHPQLRKLWSLKLSHWYTQGYHSPLTPVFYPGPPRVEMMANNFSRCGYRFVPLVLAYCALACRIDILFLRRDNGRGAIVQGGDLIIVSRLFLTE
jgi:hypothetical protein